MELNQYALYSMNTNQSAEISDMVDYIHNKLDRTNYEEAKKFLSKIFKNVQKPGDKEGFNFKRENTGLICKMEEDETIIVVAKRNDKEDIAWISVKVPNT